ncbi:hypothetical protein DTO021D3_7090 [Paecilomyces variotii]|nr:hypothetical protein DTO032I3_5246 [Paecilomyces variotii]KAJ9276047.1 hypothetical protein DTO021D3_7090 [Paecilomyces variotii]KAJ9288350.1 hypothetical protein DTO021C3_4128 [Paecilomyces variotii]KAJ9342243.1 hypothetical protein DTO027B6_5172 [Paecilomyces variotii]KAJ9375925.1 hypothetical protein DTO032I4_8807 [Paecilomyces variotii]
MPTKSIFLMGAPLPENLVWDEEGLLNAPIPPFSGENISDGKMHAASATHSVRWRVLQGSRRASETTADPLRGSEEALFLTPRDLNNVVSVEDPAFGGCGGTSSADDPDVLSKFYNHSFTIYETSAAALPAESTDWESSGDSVQTSSTGISARTHAGQGGPLVGSFPPIRGTISDLKDIPNAAYLHSIVPQTMTVNLVVGVIAVYPRRRVLTRWQRELDIVELIVGDNTKAGFGVTIWLPPAEQTTKETNSERGAGGGIRADALGQAVAGLRPRDIVLLRTVGLSSFRERVYGQSLRHGLTQIDLLYRQPVDLSDPPGIYTSRAIDAASADDLRTQKVRRVRDWIRNFVGSGPDEAGGDPGMCGASNRRPLLPPDTQ